MKVDSFNHDSVPQITIFQCSQLFDYVIHAELQITVTNVFNNEHMKIMNNYMTGHPPIHLMIFCRIVGCRYITSQGAGDILSPPGLAPK